MKCVESALSSRSMWDGLSGATDIECTTLRNPYKGMKAFVLCRAKKATLCLSLTSEGE